MLSFRNIICILSFCLIKYGCGSYYDDHCWKDFIGKKPSNTLDAGYDQHGNAINIGQVLHGKALVPGEIHHNKSFILYEYYGVHIGMKNIKILCTKHPERFLWIPTKPDEIKNLNKYLVSGGYENDTYPFYIGRVKTNGELRVGKIECQPECTELHIADFNGKDSRFEEFEILAYNATATHN